MSKLMRGIFAIPPTPFTPDYEIDEAGLASCIDFCVRAGGHGIVIPVNASEFTSLSDDERKKTVESAVRAANGRVPVIAGVSGICAKVAVMFARHAEDSGADAVIAMPPYINKASNDEIFDYYYKIGKAVKIPIFIQNFVGPMGTPMHADFLVKLLGEIENVDYVKEETAFAGRVMTQLLERAESLPADKFKGVMGGKAGRYIIDEYRRGSCGNMPACEAADIHVRIWNALEAGDEKTAAEIYDKLLPLLNFEALYGSTMYKEVLKRRGVIRYSTVRQSGDRPFDKNDGLELERILEEIRPLFTVTN